MRLPLATAAALALLAPPAAAGDVQRRQQGSATIEDVPAIPAEVSAAVQRYQNSRSAALADWTDDGQLLILTRFGATAQLHRVAMPGGDRTQLTFYGEPIAGAMALPGSGRILFGRDTGGDEWFQLYSMTPGAEPLRLTEAGTRNESPVIQRDGRRVFWAHSVKGSGDYTIEAADPADPATRATVFRGSGAIAPADVSDDGRSVISDAKFARGGRSVLAISNRGSDVRRLVEIDVASGRMTPASPELRWDVETFALSDDRRTLAYAVNEDGMSRVVVQDFVTRRALPQPKLPTGVLGGLRFSRDGRRLAIGLASPGAPGLWSLRAWRVSARSCCASLAGCVSIQAPKASSSAIHPSLRCS